jgi:hypothetical protein
MRISGSFSENMAKIRKSKDYFFEWKNSLSQEMKKKLIIGSVALGLAIAAPTSYPFIKQAYQKYKAESLISQAEQELKTLDKLITDSETEMRNNSFLMTPPEIKALQDQKEETSDRRIDFNDSLSNEKKKFVLKKYASIRDDLDETRVMEKGAKKPTIINLTKAEQKALTYNIINFCKTKRGLRNTVWDNERFLKARLHKPMPYQLETIDDIWIVGDKYFKMVTRKSDELDAKLSLLPDILRNSLGENMEAHRPILDHITNYGRRQQVKDHGSVLFEQAVQAYLKVEPENNKLIWYRDRIHDGKWLTKKYSELLSQQNPVVNNIHLGDNKLYDLEKYYKEIHQQWIEYVSDQGKNSKSYSHSRTVVEPCTKIDGDGKASMDICTDTEYYSTPGYEFYYTLKRITPSGTSTQTVTVGEKDSEDTLSYRSWDYDSDEQVGYLREWKRLHDDNVGIVKGGIYTRNSVKIEQMPDECEKHN